MKVTITIPETLAEITLDQYQKFEKINTPENKDTNFLLQKTVQIFSNLDLQDIAKIKFSDVQEIIADINKVFKQKTKLIPTFKMNGQKYGFIPRLDDMTLGEYIDLDNYLVSWETMHKAMSVLYRPITIQKGERYQIEEYTAKEDAEKFKSMSLDVAMGALFFLYNLNRELSIITQNYLNSQVKNNPTFQQHPTLQKNGGGFSLFTDWRKEMLSSFKKLPK